MNGAVVALAGFWLASAVASVQPPAIILPDTVCLTNDCNVVDGEARALAEALEAGDIRSAYALGSTPEAALDAIWGRHLTRLSEEFGPDSRVVATQRELIARMSDVAGSGWLEWGQDRGVIYVSGPAAVVATIWRFDPDGASAAVSVDGEGNIVELVEFNR